MKSKVGFILALIFFIVTTLLDIYALSCSDMFCGLIATFLAMPWFFIPVFNDLPKLFGDTFFTLILYQLINLILIYFIGVWISKIIKKTSNIK